MKTNEFEAFLSLNAPASCDDIEHLLLSKSNLPGPRANLTFATQFADYFRKKDVPDFLWRIVMQWVHISVDETSDDVVREYLPFCALQALGAHFPSSDEKDVLANELKVAMRDPCWRIRESSAIAFQIIGEDEFAVVEHYFSQWLLGATLLEQRALLAALAHPPILEQQDHARFALKMADQIMASTVHMSGPTRKTDDFKVLKKALDYCLSVFVAALPEEGFELLDRYSRMHDRVIASIIKSNLGKARIKKKYPAEVTKICDNISA